MNRLAPATGLLVILLAACGDGGGPSRRPQVLVAPLLDSIFVGDTIASGAVTVTYLDAAGDTQPAGPLSWGTANTAVFTVDGTGRIIGTGRGVAVLSVVANGDTGNALVVVSDSLDLTLLLDTVYLMQGDTFAIPVQALQRGGGSPAVWFTPSSTPGVFTVDSTGKVVATGAGGPFPYIAHASGGGADTVSDTGAVEVVLLSDTTGGKGFFSVLGTAIRRTKASVRGVNYKRQGDTLTFRLTLSVSSGNVNVENVVITTRQQVVGPTTVAIDSISPTEAFGAGNDFVCRPARDWGLWSIRTSNLTITSLSRPGGTLRIARVTSVLHGQAISGWFTLPTQRTDLYTDPDGGLPVRGTFVAPLILDTRPC